MQFWVPDDGRKIRLKHVERLTEINKLWNVTSCWLYSANILAMHGHMNVKWNNVCLQLNMYLFYTIIGRAKTADFHILPLNLHIILCIFAVLFKLHMLCCIMIRMTHCDVTKWHCWTLCVDKINGTYRMYSDCFQTRWTGSHNNAYLIFEKSSSKVRTLIISQQLIRHCLNEYYCQTF